MNLLKYLLLCHFFILVSCDNLSKKDSELTEEQIDFIGEVSVLTKELSNNIVSKIRYQFSSIDGYCKKPSFDKLQAVKNLAKDLKHLFTYSLKQYEDNKYSFDNVKIKDEKSTVHLGSYLLDVGTVLSDKDRLRYKAILNNNNVDQACQNLKNNYVFSYKSYYNVRDNIDIAKHMKPWAQSIYKAINCLCP